MSRFWKRDRDRLDLEAMLRSNRPEPADEFVASVIDRIRGNRTSLGLGRMRVAFAAALSVVMLTAFASLGGFGQATASLGQVVQTAGKAVGKNKDGPTTAQHNASQNQYKTTICHRTGSEKNPFVEITVSNNALPAHQAHGDIIPAPPGGCPGTR